MQTSMLLRRSAAAGTSLRGSTPARLPTAINRCPVVAMAKFQSKKDRNPAVPKTFTLGFTKGNELFVGRMAMIGFASALIGEVLTGKGALSQLGYEVGVPEFEVDWFIVALIGFNALAAILPASGTFVPEEKQSQKSRVKGSLQDPKISLTNPKKFFGLQGGFGFTKENELFVGRVAQLGFASALVGEVVTGKGPLGQFDFETGIPLQDTEFGLLIFIAFFLLAAVNEGTGKFVNDDEPY